MKPKKGAISSPANAVVVDMVSKRRGRNVGFRKPAAAHKTHKVESKLTAPNCGATQI